ncbi:hypothetical protein C355_03392, partial [Cryptococcus neoformans Th84]
WHPRSPPLPNKLLCKPAKVGNHSAILQNNISVPSVQSSAGVESMCTMDTLICSQALEGQRCWIRGKIMRH